MTDIVERLHNIRDHLRSGRFGQREVWEKDLDEAAAEIVRLTTELAEIAVMGEPHTALELRKKAAHAVESKP